MANVLWYYSSSYDLGCGCCSERVAEYELCDESGKILEWGECNPSVIGAKELKDMFSYLVKQYGEFEAHPDNVYL